jgi:penicillin-binding protein 1C
MYRLSQKKFVFPTFFLAFLLAVLLWALDQHYPPRLPDEAGDFARVVLDRDGLPLRAFADAQGVWRYPVGVDEVSPLYLQALLGYEDRWFYYHPGFNPVALLRAAWLNFSSGRIVSGGSTLTMQVARLLYPHKRSVAGKLTQILRAMQLEWHLDKAEILQLYLNHAPFGGTIEGVAAASHAWLQKSPQALTHAEAALLAVLPQAPSRLRPDRHPFRAQKARDKVLKRLETLGIWPAETLREARRETVAGYAIQQPMLAPLLARRLVQQLPDQRIIKTTIDSRIQANTRNILRNYLQRLPLQSSAAALIVDNKTSEVLAYAGSVDFLDATRYGQVDMVQARRSPGSTLKPFLYGLALDAGLIHSESLLGDVPRSGKAYRPSNFEQGFSGPVSVSYALQQSLNIPAVNLLEHYGPHQFVARLHNAGLTLKLPAGAQANLSVILGGAGISLESLVSGYMAFSQQGFASRPRLLHDQPAEKHKLLSPGAAWIISDILRKTPQPGRLRHAIVDQQQDIAWKTGTSYGFRDSWAIGTNGDYTIGIWVGRPDGTPMPGFWGGKTAAPLMFQLFQSLGGAGIQHASQPDSVVKITICWPLGTAAALQPPQHCRQKREAWVLGQQIPPTLADRNAPYLSNPVSYWINPATGLRVDARCRVDTPLHQSIALWPAELQPWLPRSQRTATLLPATDPTCPGPLTQPQARLKILGIQQDSQLRSPRPGQWPAINLKAQGGTGWIDWYINGRHQYHTGTQTVISHAFTQAGNYQIIAVDGGGNVDKVELSVLGE